MPLARVPGERGQPGARRFLDRWATLAVFPVVLLLSGASLAQVTPEEHAAHHPGGAQGPGSEGSSEEPGGMGGMMGEGMGDMMSAMGVPPPKELYPLLMDLPDLPLEKRGAVSEQAHARMKEGASLLSRGLEELSRAAPSDDFRTMQAALGSMREGLTRFESGLAAHRALAEGKAPRNVALQWFKTEMNLLPPGRDEVARWMGMTPFHTLVMLVLVVFAVAMLAMYFFKMRRATALLEALAAAPVSGTSAASVEPDLSGHQAEPVTPKADPKDSNAGTLDAGVDAECCAPQESCPTEGEAATDGASTGLLPLQRRKLCRLRVARIYQETPDVKTFRLVACHGGGVPFSYLPGQFLTLTLPVGEKPIRRSYTISSSPTQGYYCEITVKREDHGAGSRYLHDHVSVGDTFEVQAPSGRLVFTGKEAEHIVLIAGGVGITPMMSVARALTDMEWDGRIDFIVACTDPEHFIFEADLARLQERHENLHVFVAMSRIDKDSNGYRKGRLSRELLAEWVPNITSARVHLCGPPAMMDAVRKMLSELDVPDGSVHTENFGGEQKPRVRAEARAATAATEPAEPGGRLSFERSGKSVHLQPDETLLEAAERCGVDIDYSCRVGMCGVCAVKLLQGEVSMEVEDGLEPEDREAGMVLACQAKSTGDVSIDV
jgi:ferredoxin-NADP reductase